MKTFLDFITEQEKTPVRPQRSYAQYLAENGWKPYPLNEDFTEPLAVKKGVETKSTPKGRKTMLLEKQ